MASYGHNLIVTIFKNADVIYVGPSATNLINMSKWTTAEFWPPIYKTIKHINFLSQEKNTRLAKIHKIDTL